MMMVFVLCSFYLPKTALVGRWDVISMPVMICIYFVKSATVTLTNGNDEASNTAMVATQKYERNYSIGRSVDEQGISLIL